MNLSKKIQSLKHNIYLKNKNIFYSYCFTIRKSRFPELVYVVNDNFKTTDNKKYVRVKVQESNYSNAVLNYLAGNFVRCNAWGEPL